MTYADLIIKLLEGRPAEDKKALTHHSAKQQFLLDMERATPEEIAKWDKEWKRLLGGGVYNPQGFKYDH